MSKVGGGPTSMKEDVSQETQSQPQEQQNTTNYSINDRDIPTA